MPIYSREELENMNVKHELKPMAVKMGLAGLSKAVKAVVIDAILESQGPKAVPKTTASIAPAAAAKAMNAIEFCATAVLTKPSAKKGDKCSTTIRVTSGASSGNFPVAGRTVAEVAEFFREVLNIEKMSPGLVNGKNVEGTHVLKDKDELEFLKPAGSKG
jgi:hypothetical protein